MSFLKRAVLNNLISLVTVCLVAAIVVGAIVAIEALTGLGMGS